MKIRICGARADRTYGGIRMFNCNDVRRYCSEYGVRVVFMQNYSNGSAGLNRFWAPFAYPLATLQCNNAACIYDLPFCTSTTVSCSVMCTFTLAHILYII